MDYDVIVLGGGSAGTAAAAAAVRAGARTAMINRDELGGLCILRGCMPTKSMLAAAHALHEAEHLEPFGVRLEGRVFADFPSIMERKERHVRRFQRAKIAAIEAGGYEVLSGDARLAADGSVLVDSRRLSAPNVVLATGSVPERLDLPGLDDVPVLTSDDVMALSRRPRALLVQGAGPIGLELAQFFARIGTRVTVVNRSPLLSRHDAACGEELERALAGEERLELAVPGTIDSLAPRGDGLVARVSGGGRTFDVEADALLMAVGRRPAVDGLGLEKAGVAVEYGKIAHDETMRTSNPNVWVAGDVTGSFQILHLATQEGAVAGHNAAVGAPERRMDYRLRMGVIFTDPPFAHVGATESEAAHASRPIVTAEARFGETGRAITMGVERGLWRMFADAGTGELLGSAIVGPRADDLIHVVATLMHSRSTAADVLGLPWYHPTLSEVILDLARGIERARAS